MLYEEKPKLEELPTHAQLLRASIAAVATAIVLMVAVVLPAEYGIDPTGAGRVLGLTEMGEIRMELQEELENDEHHSESSGDPSSLLSLVFAQFVPSAHAQEGDGWRDEVTFTLAPGDTYEVKLSMQEGEVATYQMIVEGGRVNFDLHAHGNGQSITYEKGRGSKGAEGELVAAFPGDHGWFWRNRDDQELTVMLSVKGAYSELKQGN